MALIHNWRDVLVHAWSMRLLALAFVLEAIEVALPFFSDAMPSGVFAILGLAVSAGAIVARLIAQPKSLPPAAPIISAPSQETVL